jgi:hypothetical protein
MPTDNFRKYLGPIGCILYYSIFALGLVTSTVMPILGLIVLLMSLFVLSDQWEMMNLRAHHFVGLNPHEPSLSCGCNICADAIFQLSLLEAIKLLLKREF